LDISDLLHALQPDSGNYVAAAKVDDPSKRFVHGLAPAQGLILAEVHYPLEAVRLDEDTK
jgi:hypothetical protein